MTFCHVTNPGKQCKRPPTKQKKFVEEHADCCKTNAVRFLIGASAQTRKRTQDDVDQAERVEKEERQQQDEKRRRQQQQELKEHTYWNSPEAEKLFFSRGTGILSVKDMLDKRIELLQNVHATVDGWKNVVETCDKDNLCTAADIKTMQERCMTVCRAHLYARTNMNSWRWVEDCCKEACKNLVGIGVRTAINPQTVALWNRIFRLSEKFPHP